MEFNLKEYVEKHCSGMDKGTRAPLLVRGDMRTIYYDIEGRIHRLDGPAVKSSYYNEYYLHGIKYDSLEEFIVGLDNLILEHKLDIFKII